MAAAAAVTGVLTDPRDYSRKHYAFMYKPFIKN
jgi:hypothetical protein